MQLSPTCFNSLRRYKSVILCGQDDEQKVIGSTNITEGNDEFAQRMSVSYDLDVRLLSVIKLSFFHNQDGA